MWLRSCVVFLGVLFEERKINLEILKDKPSCRNYVAAMTSRKRSKNALAGCTSMWA